MFSSDIIRYRQWVPSLWLLRYAIITLNRRWLQELAMHSVAGTWRGVYHYEPPSEDLEARAVGFTLVIEQGWLGRVRGTFSDDPDLGVPLEAGIQGRLRGERLFFRKMPAEFLTLGKQGLRPVVEFVEETFGEQVRGHPRAPHIHYHGHLDPEHGRVEGLWHIPSYLLPLRSSTRYLVFQETHGTWWMERKIP
jgi:hypothetical protein